MDEALLDGGLLSLWHLWEPGHLFVWKTREGPSLFLSFPCDFFHKVFFYHGQKEDRFWAFLTFQQSWGVPASIPQGWWGLGTNTDPWMCFRSQHALPVHFAHGNVWVQKRHCNEVFQTPEWPLQGRAQVSLSCQLDGCGSYWCQLNSPKLTELLFLAAE